MANPNNNPSRPRAPECSVCIANYNGEAFIRGCIDSVLNQECDFPIEIILHDDASEDKSVELVRSTYPDMTLIASRQNVGFCESNNRMAEAANGKYLLLLNNDAELLPKALSTLHSYAQELQKPAILTLPQYDYASDGIVDRGSLVDLFMNPVPNQDPHRREVAMGIGACLWIPKDLWHQLGGFPTWFESLAEDMYLCTVARLKGVPIRVPDASGYRHRQGQSFGGGKVVADELDTTVRRRQMSERNKTFTMLICYPAPWHVPFLTVHFLALAIEGFCLSIIKRDFRLWRKIYWNCFKSVWVDLDHLLQKRAEEQSKRRAGFFEFFSTSTWVPRKIVMLIRFGVPKIR
jgi:GT2 family glycosyltransferase